MSCLAWGVSQLIETKCPYTPSMCPSLLADDLHARAVVIKIVLKQVYMGRVSLNVKWKPASSSSFYHALGLSHTASSLVLHMHQRAPAKIFNPPQPLCALQPFGKMGVNLGGPLTLDKNKALCVCVCESAGVSKTCRRKIATWLTTARH